MTTEERIADSLERVMKATEFMHRAAEAALVSLATSYAHEALCGHRGNYDFLTFQRVVLVGLFVFAKSLLRLLETDAAELQAIVQTADEEPDDVLDAVAVEP